MPDEQQGEDESDPTPLGFPRVRRTRSALSAVTFVEQEVLDRNDVEHVQFGHDSGSSGTASPIASAETGAGSPNMDISSPPHSPPSLPGMGGSLLLPREQSGVDLLAMVALQEQENSAGTDTPRERTISRWMTSTTVGSDDSDLTRKCSTNSSGSVTIATLDTRRFSIGSGILDALEDIRLSEQQFEDEDGGTKGLKRSWSAREAARPARGDAMSDYEAAERRDSSPNRINPIKRAQSSRHPLSNQF